MNIRLLSAAVLTLALSACATGPDYRSNSGYPDQSHYAGRCMNCGRVERIEQFRGERRSTGAGAVVGGIGGGVLGNTVGKGDGRTAATVVGAVGGAVVGNEIEKNNNGASSFDIYVRMDNGRKLIVTQRDIGNIREGSYVSVEAGHARLVR
jgi:outer membrane lipoprotein SlyB